MEPAPELPRVSPEFVALRMVLEAYVRTQGPRGRRRFEKALAEVVLDHDPKVVALTRADLHVEIERSQAQAREWLHRAIVAVMART